MRKVTLPAIWTGSSKMRKRGRRRRRRNSHVYLFLIWPFEVPGGKHISQIGRATNLVTYRLLVLSQERFTCTISDGVVVVDFCSLFKESPYGVADTIFGHLTSIINLNTLYFFVSLREVGSSDLSDKALPLRVLSALSGRRYRSQ